MKVSGWYLGKDNDNKFSDPIYVTTGSNSNIIINNQHSIFKRHAKKDVEVLEEFLVIYKIAELKAMGDMKKFEELLFKALENWRRK